MEVGRIENNNIVWFTLTWSTVRYVCALCADSVVDPVWGVNEWRTVSRCHGKPYEYVGPCSPYSIELKRSIPFGHQMISIAPPLERRTSRKFSEHCARADAMSFMKTFSVCYTFDWQSLYVYHPHHHHRRHIGPATEKNARRTIASDQRIAIDLLTQKKLKRIEANGDKLSIVRHEDVRRWIGISEAI